MRTIQKNNMSNFPRRLSDERGVVLLIVLIMLVAMTLAGIGMMRSVDTASIVAGNLAFKQTTLNAADGGSASAFNNLAIVANSGNPKDKLILNLDPGQNCPVGVSPSLMPAFCPVGKIVFEGYRSSAINPCEVSNTCGNASPPGCAGYTYADWYKCDAIWNGAPTVNVTDANNNTVATVSYWIHRMCTLPNNIPINQLTGGGQLCQFYVPPSEDKANASPALPNYYYRITTRATGPRNTATYTQTLVLISQ